MPKPQIDAGLVRRRRQELNLSHARLAEQIGAHEQTIVKIENGEIRNSRHVPMLEQVLGVPLLLGDHETSELGLLRADVRVLSRKIEALGRLIHQLVNTKAFKILIAMAGAGLASYVIVCTAWALTHNEHCRFLPPHLH